MNRVLHNSLLGMLDIVETYEYYDRPVLFSCRNQVGSLFLTVWIGEDDGGSETWLFAPISQRRFEHIRSGAIDLQTAFTKVEGNTLLSVHIPFNSDLPTRTVSVDPSILDETQLPQEGEKLNLPTVTISNNFDVPARRAIQTRREHIDLSLGTIIPERTEAPAGRLGSVISNLQHLLNSIGNKIFGTGAIKGSFSQDTVVDMQVNVIGFSPGSFRVNIASSATADLFDDTKVSAAVGEALNLIRIAEDSSALQNRLMDLGSRVASSFVDFLEVINLDITQVEIDWGSPHPEKGGAASISSITAQRTAKSIRLFEEQASREYEITGKLIGANLRTMKFEVEIDESSIAGDIDNDAKNIVDGAVLGSMYVIRIREVEIYKPMVEESSLKFYLMSLRISKTDPEV